MLQNSFTKWENSPKVTKATAWQLKILLGTGLSSEAETVRGYAYPLRLKLFEDGPILLGRNCTKMGLFFEAETVRRLAYLLRLKLYKDGSILWGWNCSMIFKEMPIVWGRNCSIRFVNLPLFLDGQTTASFCLLPFFSTIIFQENWRLQLDSNSDCWNRRRAGWPFDHNYHGPNWQIHYET